MHPEVSFRVLAGRDLAPKKTAVGQSERLAVLQPVFKDVATSVQEIRCTISGALLGLHDVLDAYAALWTALRVRAGHAKILGDMTSDRCGLPMRMFV
jgi:predicted RNase H-like nuclease